MHIGAHKSQEQEQRICLSFPQQSQLEHAISLVGLGFDLALVAAGTALVDPLTLG